MSINSIIEVVGGMAIFLYGMFIMSDSIQKMAGEQVKTILLKLTGGPVKGYLTGLIATCLIQASAATIIMEMSFVSAGLLSFSQTLAVTMGAQLGTTITAQLVAFKITKYALPVITVSFFITLFSKNNTVKNAAGLFLGFGILFFGIDIMSKALFPLRQYPPFLKIMATVEDPLLGIGVGFLFTMITQSSSATSGVTVAMAFAHTITLQQAIPINLGASIGTTLTPFLGSVGMNREGKRVAWGHIFTQIIGVFIVFLLLIPRIGNEAVWILFVKWFTRTIVGTQDVARQIAMAHSLMPLATAVVCLPLVKLISGLLLRLFPSLETEKPFKADFITDTVVEIPALALDLSKKEILHMCGIVDSMLKGSISLFEKKEKQLADSLSLTDIKVDILRDTIVPFLTKVEKQGLTEKEKKTEINHIYIVNAVESIGDII
ncbi:MAG: Na/Pi cotransporter family protein, partial [bacterium]|nr:Na/Pi cotransporter family protein [bacterium]